jgi:flagellar motor switch protein FliM
MDEPTPTPENAASDTQQFRRDAAASPAPQRFDFRHPVFLSSPEWRKLRREVEDFVESLGALLSTYFRLDVGLQLGRMQTMPFSEFTAGMPARTHLALFKLDPLRGVSVLELRPAIGLAIVDRLLGGPGKPASLDRDLTEMEVALLDQTVQILLSEWCKQWSRIQELRAEILGHESNPKFLQCASGETAMLVVTLEARMVELVERIQLAIPYASFEPVVNKLTQTGANSGPPAPAAPPATAKWNARLDDVPLTLAATWPSMKLPTRRLMELKPGDLLELPAEGAERVEIRVGKTAKFKGRLGTREGRWAVQINSICKV